MSPGITRKGATPKFNYDKSLGMRQENCIPSFLLSPTESCDRLGDGKFSFYMNFSIR